MTSALLVVGAAVMCASLVSATPPGIYISGSNPLKLSEYWAPHDVGGGCGATNGQVNAGAVMPKYEGTAVVSVNVPGVTGNYAFYSGGYDGSTGAYMPTTSSYSIAGVTAIQGSDMIVPRAYHAMAVLQASNQPTKVIVCGGKSNGGAILASCEITVFKTGTSSQFTPLKPLTLGNLYGHTMVSVNSRQTVYLFGGTNGGGATNPLVYEYDVTADSWLAKTPTGGIWSGLTYAATFTINGDTDAVTCGGLLGGQVQKNCYLYDSQANAMSAYGSLRIRREKFSIVPFNQNNNNLEYFAVGGSDSVEATADVEVSKNGSYWQIHCGSLFNAMQAAATVALTL